MRDVRRRVVVMGVSAVGKSTVGAALAARWDIPFIDGDDLHSAQSITKMSTGTPLNDHDRGPWLVACGRALADAPDGAVLACSALARRYRAVLLAECPDAEFVHLVADPVEIMSRARHRDAHFMPPVLLRSQLDALEPLDATEPGIEIDAGQELAVIVDRVDGALSRRMRHAE